MIALQHESEALMHALYLHDAHDFEPVDLGVFGELLA